MSRKAQITTFVIIGIIILVLVAIGLYTRDNVYLISPGAADLNSELSSIQSHVLSCMQSSAETPIMDIGRQGGFLNPSEGTYRQYANSRISYLCFSMADTEKCRSRILLKQDMEKQISDAVYGALKTCIDLDSLKKIGAYEIVAEQDLKVSTSILKDRVIVSLGYPISLRSTKSEAEANGPEEYARSFDYPLGDLYDVSRIILDDEADFGDFNPLPYMVMKKGEYKIEKSKPYPDKVYKLTRRDSNYVFEFAIEGEPS